LESLLHLKCTPSKWNADSKDSKYSKDSKDNADNADNADIADNAENVDCLDWTLSFTFEVPLQNGTQIAQIGISHFT
jgi:hypothetical protein